MGMVSLLLVRHDSLQAIADDRNFGLEIKAVIVGASCNRSPKSSLAAKSRTAIHTNAAEWLGEMHASDCTFARCHGNTGEKLSPAESAYLERCLQRFRKKAA